MPPDMTQRLGPNVRSDIVDVYVFRRPTIASQPGQPIEFLQMRRAQGALVGSWHPVMGHIEPGETAPQTAIRELAEETGYTFGRVHPTSANEPLSVSESDGKKTTKPLGGTNATKPSHAIGFWQLELVNVYYLASHESIVMSPGFAVEVPAGSDPVLDDSHDAFHWIGDDQVDRFLWPGQREAIRHITRDIATPTAQSELRDRLKLDPFSLPNPIDR